MTKNSKRCFFLYDDKALYVTDNVNKIAGNFEQRNSVAISSKLSFYVNKNIY